MTDFGYTLVIGDKNLSSWSLRAWLLMKHAEIPFIEEKIRLRQPDMQDAIKAHSPSGLVPALKTPDGVIWDSLAIAEFLNESHPAAQLWPPDRRARAVARSVSAEMHAGFANLRATMPLDFVNRIVGRTPVAAAAREIERIVHIWTECRETFGGGGPFLFGRFSIADAMYAPLVSRFRTYGVEIAGLAKDYADMLWALPAMREWEAGAAHEVEAA